MARSLVALAACSVLNIKKTMAGMNMDFVSPVGTPSDDARALDF